MHKTGVDDHDPEVRETVVRGADEEPLPTR
jgi:hypothetical protein